jgi:hypothetical protein
MLQFLPPFEIQFMIGFERRVQFIPTRKKKKKSRIGSRKSIFFGNQYAVGFEQFFETSKNQKNQDRATISKEILFGKQFTVKFEQIREGTRISSRKRVFFEKNCSQLRTSFREETRTDETSQSQGTSILIEYLEFLEQYWKVSDHF